MCSAQQDDPEAAGGGTRGAAVGGPQARGVVNRPQTVTEWAEAVVDTAQIDVADRIVPAGLVDDALSSAPTLRVSAGAGRVELLVGGWLDGSPPLFSPTSAVRHVWRGSLLREGCFAADILSNMDTGGGKAGEEAAPLPADGGHGYFGPRNKG